MSTFKWGFVGAGMIAKKALYPAITRSNVGEIYAVASRDANKAMTISPNGKIYLDYDQLFADPEVDGVYISLPNAFHLPVAIRAMKAGKHVLCEKAHPHHVLCFHLYAFHHLLVRQHLCQSTHRKPCPIDLATEEIRLLAHQLHRHA